VENWFKMATVYSCSPRRCWRAVDESLTGEAVECMTKLSNFQNLTLSSNHPTATVTKKMFSKMVA